MKTFWTILAILMLTTWAAAQDVSYNFDAQADFSKYKTYRWEQHPDSLQVDDLTKSQLAAALNAELAKRGLSQSSDANSDLVIVYQIALRNEKQLTSFSTGWGTGPGWGRRWSGGLGSSTTTTNVSNITIGSLDLDMFDRAEKRLIWRGVVSKAIDAKAKPDKRQKNMAKAAEKLLKNYPPPRKK